MNSKNTKLKKASKQTVGAFLAISIGLGLALSNAMNSSLAGMSLGVVIGLAIVLNYKGKN